MRESLCYSGAPYFLAVQNICQITYPSEITIIVRLLSTEAYVLRLELLSFRKNGISNLLPSAPGSFGSRSLLYQSTVCVCFRERYCDVDSKAIKTALGDQATKKLSSLGNSWLR